MKGETFDNWSLGRKFDMEVGINVNARRIAVFQNSLDNGKTPDGTGYIINANDGPANYKLSWE